jgi:hypothetical protein
MNIDSVGFTNSQVRGYEKLKKEQEPQDVVEPQVDEAQEEESLGDDGGQRGVIRNLMEGHYKGVADVRLRINFQEEIAAIENQQLQSASVANAGSVTQSVNTAVNSLVESGDLTQEQADEAIEAFQTAVDQVLEDFASSQPASTEDLVSALNSIFEQLLGFLQSTQVSEDPVPEQLITQEPPPEEPPADPTEPPVPEAETPPEPVEPPDEPSGPLVPDEPIDPVDPLPVEPPEPLVTDMPIDPVSTLPVEPLEPQTLEEPVVIEPLLEPIEPPVSETPPEPVEPLPLEPVEPPLLEDPIEPQSPPEPQGPTQFELFLEELTGLFNASVEGFIESLDSVSVLPPLSEPSGNGAAYEKFLAIYNDMIGAPLAQGEPEGAVIDAIG